MDQEQFPGIRVEMKWQINDWITSIFGYVFNKIIMKKMVNQTILLWYLLMLYILRLVI